MDSIGSVAKKIIKTLFSENIGIYSIFDDEYSMNYRYRRAIIKPQL